jgi:hypothetical protein
MDCLGTSSNFSFLSFRRPIFELLVPLWRHGVMHYFKSIEAIITFMAQPTPPY